MRQLRWGKWDGWDPPRQPCASPALPEMLSPRREGVSSSTQVLTQLRACSDPLEGNWTIEPRSPLHASLGPQRHQKDVDSTFGGCIAAMWHRHAMKPTYPAVPSQTGHRVISSDVSYHHPAPPAAFWPTWPHSHLLLQPITLRPGDPAGKTPAPPAPRAPRGRTPWHAPGTAALPDLAACWVGLSAVLAGTDARWDALPPIIQHQPLGAVAARDADVVKAGAGAGPVQTQVGTGPAAGAAALLVHLAPCALSACRDGHGAGNDSGHPALPCTAQQPAPGPIHHIHPVLPHAPQPIPPIHPVPSPPVPLLPSQPFHLISSISFHPSCPTHLI